MGLILQRTRWKGVGISVTYKRVGSNWTERSNVIVIVIVVECGGGEGEIGSTWIARRIIKCDCDRRFKGWGVGIWKVSEGNLLCIEFV